MVTGIKTISQQQVVNNNMGTMNGITTAQIPPPEPVKRPSDARRSNKPIMEKRRRARINNCLNELKTLILDAMKKDDLSYLQPARHSKLEKADILEMTVKYLENLQRQQAAMSQATDPNVVNKFKAGFSECANEVGRFPGLEPQVKRRLLQHLSNCLNGVKTEVPQTPQPQSPQTTVQVHILPSPPSSPEQEHNSHSHHQTQQHQQQSHITATQNGYFLTNGAGNGVQLIPTKMANGNIAFVLPQSMPTQTQIPMLVPIPTRTSSTGSATSNMSSNYERVREHSTSPYNAPPSPANSSYEPMDCAPAHQNVPHRQSSPHQHQIHLQQQQQAQHQQQYQQPPQHHHHLHQQQHLQQTQQRSFSPSVPISLVMRKPSYEHQQIKDEEKPWRPW